MRPWYLENVNRHCLAALVKADWGRDSESFHLLPLQFCKKAFPPCQTLIIYALLGNERREKQGRWGKHPEPVSSLPCRAYRKDFKWRLEKQQQQQHHQQQMWADHLCPRTVGQALCPPLPLRGVDAAERGQRWGTPPSPTTRHEYLQRFWISPPLARSQEASLACLPRGEPWALKSFPLSASRAINGVNSRVNRSFFILKPLS